MILKQIAVCADRMPDEELRQQFLDLHAVANELAEQATHMRQAAWVLFHMHVPPELPKVRG